MATILYDSILSGYKNKIINGDLDYWQRVTSSSYIISDTYIADRWLCSTITNTPNIYRYAFPLSDQRAVDGCSPSYYASYNTNYSGTASCYTMIQQKIEDVRTLAGQDITISFWGWGTVGNVAIDVFQDFGTGGDATVKTIGKIATLSGNWAKHQINLTLPTVDGKNIKENNHLGIRFWISHGTDRNAYFSDGNAFGQTGSFNFTRVQVEKTPQNGKASTFEYRPPHIELEMCQRYFESSFPPNQSYFITDIDDVSNVSYHGFRQYVWAIDAWASPYRVFNSQNLLQPRIKFITEKRVRPTVNTGLRDGGVIHNGAMVTGWGGTVPGVRTVRSILPSTVNENSFNVKMNVNWPYSTPSVYYDYVGFFTWYGDAEI